MQDKVGSGACGRTVLMDFTYSTVLRTWKRTGGTAVGRQWAYFVIVMNMESSFARFCLYRTEIKVFEYRRSHCSFVEEEQQERKDFCRFGTAVAMGCDMHWLVEHGSLGLRNLHWSLYSYGDSAVCAANECRHTLPLQWVWVPITALPHAIAPLGTKLFHPLLPYFLSCRKDSIIYSLPFLFVPWTWQNRSFAPYPLPHKARAWAGRCYCDKNVIITIWFISFCFVFLAWRLQHAPPNSFRNTSALGFTRGSGLLRVTRVFLSDK